MKMNKKTAEFRKHLLLVCTICTVVIPLINNFALSLVMSFIAGDIMLVFWAELLGSFMAALDTLNLFLVFGVLVNSLVRFGAKESKRIVMLCVLRVVIIYTSYLTIGAIVTGRFLSTLTSNMFYCITNGAIDLLLLVGTVVMVSFLRVKFVEEKNTNISLNGFLKVSNPLIVITLWVTGLVSAFLLSGCVISTVADISAYGVSGLNLTEFLYLVTPYLKWICKTLVGYCIMWACAKWFDVQWKNLHETEVNE